MVHSCVCSLAREARLQGHRHSLASAHQMKMFRRFLNLIQVKVETRLHQIVSETKKTMYCRMSLPPALQSGTTDCQILLTGRARASVSTMGWAELSAWDHQRHAPFCHPASPLQLILLEAVELWTVLLMWTSPNKVAHRLLGSIQVWICLEIASQRKLERLTRLGEICWNPKMLL
jgi:hypothetical protein